MVQGYYSLHIQSTFKDLYFNIQIFVFLHTQLYKYYR